MLNQKDSSHFNVRICGGVLFVHIECTNLENICGGLLIGE